VLRLDGYHQTQFGYYHHQLAVAAHGCESGMQPDVDIPPYGFGHHPQRISALGQLVRVQRVGVTGVGSGDIDARDVKAQEAAEGCAEYERPQEYRQYR
jgi:hypothetical protein